MKKLASTFVTALLVMTACNGNKTESTEGGVPTTRDSLEVALANQDSLLNLMNDITEGMNQIKDLEQILSNTADLGAESKSRRDQVREDMLCIQRALQDRRQRLSELEKKLASSDSRNATLRKSIASLKAQIASQESTIETLRKDLEAANIYIEQLGITVDSLNTTVEGVTAERDAAQQQSLKLNEELNTCYYAIGSKDELKDNNIIETGFLRKTKIMPSDFKQGFFTTADKSTLTAINLHSKKAKVLTNQPADSYEIVDDNGQKVLKITNSKRFWEVSNYLVVQID